MTAEKAISVLEALTYDYDRIAILSPDLEADEVCEALRVATRSLKASCKAENSPADERKTEVDNIPRPIIKVSEIAGFEHNVNKIMCEREQVWARMFDQFEERMRIMNLRIESLEKKYDRITNH